MRILKKTGFTRMQLSKTSIRQIRYGELDPRYPTISLHIVQPTRRVELIGIEPTTSALQGRRSPI